MGGNGEELTCKEVEKGLQCGADVLFPFEKTDSNIEVIKFETGQRMGLLSFEHELFGRVTYQGILLPDQENTEQDDTFKEEQKK